MMENILLKLIIFLNTTQTLLSGYFCEVLFISGIVLNLLIYLFGRKRKIFKQISDCFVVSIFTVSFSFLSYIYFIDKTFVLDKNTIYKLVLNLFLLFFVFISNSLTNKYKHRAIRANTCLLCFALFSFLIFKFNSTISLFILLEFIFLSVYRYICLLKIIKPKEYYSSFLTISLCASALFYLLFVIAFFTRDLFYINMIKTCVLCCVLLKIGIFPSFNYSINNRIKNQIQNALLVFCALPLSGAFIFSKLVVHFGVQAQFFDFIMLFILAICAFSFALSAFWQKDLVKFTNDSFRFYLSYVFLNIVFFPGDSKNLELIILYTFCACAIYSLLAIFKLNTDKKINTNLIKGLYFINKPLSYFITLILLIYCALAPSRVLFLNISALKNLYGYAILGVYICFFFVILNVLILLNVIRIIQSIYFVNLKPLIAFKKAITLNYVIAFLIIVFMFLSYYL